jgi:predicted transcriptional regulator
LAEGALPADVADLISHHLDSVVRLEVLLHLFHHPHAAHTAAVVAKELRIDSAWADRQLNELHARGFVSRDSSTPPVFRYAPSQPTLASAIESLVRAFNDRRVAVIAAIYSQPPDPLRSFSDAFRLRKERGEP